jgi:hypothetical protein
MTTPYKLSLPTTVEPTEGFSPNDRVVFRCPLEQGSQTKERSFRLNGILQLQKYTTVDNVLAWRAIEASDKCFLNPFAGVNGVIRQVIVSINGQIVENILEYHRMVALLNQTKWYALDGATTGDSMLELMNYSNDGYMVGDDAKAQAYNGLLFPINANQSELPFSIDLDVCVNSAVLPASKVNEVEFTFIFEDTTKCGLVSKSGVSTQFRYALKNIEMRYQCVPEAQKGDVIMEVKGNSAILTVLNKISALEHAPSSPFNSMFCSFLKQTDTNSSSSSLTKDYLATDAITEQVDYFEVKLNGSNGALSYPLRFKETEMAYSFLLACKQGDWDAKHALSYASLSQSQKTGYGLGCPFFSEYPNGSRVQFNLALKEAPATPYMAYFYTIGHIKL